MSPQTYLSFWHIEMSNLPVATFTRRALTTAEARSMVNTARAAGTLVCVAKADLGAPYCEPERESHRQLCAALREHAEIDIHLKDFFGEDCANPLCFAEIGKQRRLLVVDCHYAFDDVRRSDTTPAATSDADETLNARTRSMKKAMKMHVVPESIEFHLFEAVEPAS